jgi:hypothetical protein
MNLLIIMRLCGMVLGSSLPRERSTVHSGTLLQANAY